MNPSSDTLSTKLRSVWRRDRMAVHLTGLAWGMLLAAPLVIALFVLDRVFDLPIVARWILLAIAVDVVVVQLYRRWYSRLCEFNDLTWAGRVEQAFPQLNSLLISYVQLNQPMPAAVGSSELFPIVKAQAVEATQPLDFGETVDFRPLGPLGIRAGVALGAFIIMWLLFGSSMSVAFQRYFGSTEKYPTATNFVSAPEDQIILEGNPLSLAVEVEGQVPRSGTIHVRAASSDQWRSVPIEQNESGQFAYDIPRVEGSFEYHFEIGDASSHEADLPGIVKVVSPPRVVSQKVRVTPPAYTGLQPFTSNSLASTVPEGSALRWTVEMDKVVKTASLAGPDDWHRDGKPTADGKSIRFQFIADKAGTYRLQTTGKTLDLESVEQSFRLRLRTDDEPTVWLVEPRSDLKATVNKRQSITIRASDDYGLTEIAILYRLNGEETLHRVSLGEPPASDTQRDLQYPRSGTWPLSWQIDRDVPNLRSGDVLEMAIEVTEVAATAEQARKAVTQLREIEFLSVTEYQAYVADRFDALRRDIADSERREKLIKHAIDSAEEDKQDE